MNTMLKIIIREIMILVFSISIFPSIFLFLILRGDINRYGLTLFYREILNIGSSSFDSTMLPLLFRFFAPYLAIQAFRSYQWSKTGFEAKRFANLYFALLTGAVGIWFASNSWDLFYFMFELGDIPAELIQFFQLEAVHLISAIAGLYISYRCLLVFLRPSNQVRR